MASGYNGQTTAGFLLIIGVICSILGVLAFAVAIINSSLQMIGADPEQEALIPQNRNLNLT
jgi:hypothetical protein